MDATTRQLEAAVIALIAEKPTVSERVLREIDFRALVALRLAAREAVWRQSTDTPKYRSPSPGAKRQTTRVADTRRTFVRDHFTCRYAHCQRPTVHLDVLKQLSAAFPSILPYQSNWRPVDEHILYWIYSTSLEHFISFPAGGTSDADNLLTACYLCNDAKNRLPADLLGWRVAAPYDANWLGLTQYLPDLRRAVATLTSSRRDA